MVVGQASARQVDIAYFCLKLERIGQIELALGVVATWAARRRALLFLKSCVRLFDLVQFLAQLRISGCATT